MIRGESDNDNYLLKVFFSSDLYKILHWVDNIFSTSPAYSSSLRIEILELIKPNHNIALIGVAIKVY